MSEKQEQEIYVSCEGPESQFIKLVSSDGFEFIIKRNHALLSPTIRVMLNYYPGGTAENETNVVSMNHVMSYTVTDACRYLTYKAKYSMSISSEGIPEFYIAPEAALELLWTANFLEC